jgi:hypothetical protein
MLLYEDGGTKPTTNLKIGRMGKERAIEGVSLNKVQYTQIWKRHDEAPLYNYYTLIIKKKLICGLVWMAWFQNALHTHNKGSVFVIY